jgi:sulfatase maturation enzyme AslB (radical SAM superfamily)
MTKNKETYCPLPFIAVDALKNRFSPCCHVKKSHFSNYSTIEDYYNSPELKSLQNNLSNGIKDNLCSTCWKNEDMGIHSMRQSVLQDRKYIEHDICQVKLHVGNTCNLACMMCFPTVSTTWNKLWNNKKYPENFIKTGGHEFYDAYMENYIKKNINHMLFIETLGGEPLFSKRFIKLLEWIINKGRSQYITLYIITNLTLLPDSFVKILSSFKRVVLAVSLEGVGKVNDYIRWGSDFQKIDKNIKIAQEKKFELAILPTANSLNLHRLSDLYSYGKSMQIPVMNISPVNGWPSLLPCNLPLHLHQKVMPELKQLLVGEQDFYSLKNFIINWDKKRNISIVDYMPEFEEFIK